MHEVGFGQSVPRTEDTRLLMGRGRFTGDIDLPRQAFAHVLRSPHAHAELRAIDANTARTMPGVLAVLTAVDARVDGIGVLPGDDELGLKGCDGRDPVTPSQPVLAGERVRYVGEPVCFVVAESVMAARDAAERIEVTYEPLPAVTETAAAVAPDAPQIWAEAANNLSVDWEAGDRDATDAAFAAAVHVTRLELVNNRVAGMPVEPGALVGDYRPEDGRYTLYTPSQGVFSLRQFLARHVLKVPESAIRVVTPDVGGSFGVRIFPTPEQGLVLWAACKLGRPVKWVAERGEAMCCDLHGRDHVTDAELALDMDGRFLALRVATVANLGAYVSPRARTSPTVGYAVGAPGAYAIPHCHVRVKAVFTNTMMTNAYRGAGRPEAIYVIERLADEAAAELGISPTVIRRRNLIPAAAMPFTTATGEIYDSGDFARNMEDAISFADIAGFAARRDAARVDGKRRGIGFSTYVKINGGTPHEAAELRFDESGSVTLAIGSQSNGQGHETAYAQLVAAGLGVSLDAVRVVQGDTQRVAYGKGTGGSSAISVGGAAVLAAVEKVIEAGTHIAGRLLEAAAADIAFADGLYVVAGTDRGVTMTEVARAAFQAGPLTEQAGFGLAGRGQYVPQARTYANGCHVCEVEIDIETGRVAILRYTVVDDIGRVLNPMLARGQIHGGLAQGAGQALLEECIYDHESGQLLSGSFMDYCMPRADDLPSFTVEFNEIPCTTNPLGVKGVGEAGVTGAPPAVVNAVVDALREFGVRHIDMPLTPERVWRALRRARP